MLKSFKSTIIMVLIIFTLSVLGAFIPEVLQSKDFISIFVTFAILLVFVGFIWIIEKSKELFFKNLNVSLFIIIAFLLRIILVTVLF